MDFETQREEIRAACPRRIIQEYSKYCLRQKCGRRVAALMPEEGGGARQPCQCLGEALGDRECSEQRQLHFTHRGLCAGLATAIWADLASASGYSQGPDIAPA